MSEEPELPSIPAIGDILDRKDRFIQKVYTVIQCGNCGEKNTRPFEKGDYTFKKLNNEKCPKCEKTSDSLIVEIFSEWEDPKKDKIFKI